MSDLIERLRDLEEAEREVSYGMDMDPAKTANWRYAETAKEAADALAAQAKEIEALRSDMACWKSAALRIGEELASVGPPGYYKMNAYEWLAWAIDAAIAAKGE